MTDIYIWQRIISPHMAGLAAALSSRGVKTTYVAEREMSESRANQGWNPPPRGDARLELAPMAEAVAEVIDGASSASIHICQGIRGNGQVGIAQKLLGKRGLKQWVVMETVDDEGPRGFMKRLTYRYLFHRWRTSVEGILATGWQTPAWVAGRAFPAGQVYPFAYFLPESTVAEEQPVTEEFSAFRFLFVGQLIPRKRVDQLIEALGQIEAPAVELIVVGDGPERGRLEALAARALPRRVTWLGRLPMSEARAVMANADCLVLPSRHDGWGAVVSEALMTGTPVVCSDACGSAGVARAAGIGGVFPSGDVDAVRGELERVVAQGRLSASERSRLSTWAQCLGADAGADYLLRILRHSQGDGDRPLPPWEATTVSW
ncbi:glycosyltransferase [Spiribacter roseus]|uniref:Glycosyltransferase n=1 Tax=Spiribacter roseus TaxID=1855875 RepID=A0ABV3RX59_9GAMM